MTDNVKHSAEYYTKQFTKAELGEMLFTAREIVREQRELLDEPTDTVQATLTERQGQYGTFANVASTSQMLQQQLKGANTSLAMQADQWEAMQVICSKLSRIFNGDPNHIDSWHDIAGYATLVADRLREEAGDG